jgi:hypothetical protein
MQHRFSKYLPFLTFLGDLCALNALFITLYLKDHFVVHTYDRSWFFFLLIVNVSWLLIVIFTKPYRTSRVYSMSQLVGSIGYTVFQHFLITFATIYFFDFILVHKWGPLVVHTAFLGIILTWRLSLYYFLSFYR